MADAQNVIDINSLGIEELTSFQRQLESELAFFNESVSELKTVSNKFGRCQATVEGMDEKDKNQEALIPLSESVYISARIPDPDSYLVEIGTGYFVQMTRQQAHDYFRRKFTFIDDQINTIAQKVLPEKQRVRQAIVVALQKKVQQMSLANGAVASGVAGDS